ncbi:MAG: alpha/beta fold hydrolase [Halobacteriales archaeon]
MSESDPYAAVNDDGSIEGLDASFVDVDGITDRVDGISTRYYEYGSGDPLVLFHGGNWSGTASANTWSRVVDGLSDEFRVLLPDRLGCGMTGNPADEDDFVYGAELEHAISFIDTMGVDEFHVGGQSRGGGISGRIAAEIPERVKTFIPIQTATLAPTAGNKDFMYARIHRDAPTDEDAPIYEADHYRHLYALQEYSPDHVTDEYALAAGYMATRSKAERTRQVLEENGGQERWLATMRDHMATTHRRMKDGELQMPTLLYWARNDPGVDVVAGIGLYDLMAAENPRVEFQLLNKAGHHLYREYPERFVETVTSFIAFHEEHGYDYGEPTRTYDDYTELRSYLERE